MIKVNRRKTNDALTLQNNAYDANTTKKLHETSRPIQYNLSSNDKLKNNHISEIFGCFT